MKDLRNYCEDLIYILLVVDSDASLARPATVDQGDDYTGSLSLALAYPDGLRLYVELQVDCSGESPVLGDYAFHCITASPGIPDRLRFRFDNAPHHPELPNFPYHLHIGNEEILPDGPPKIREVADAVRWHLDHPGQPWHRDRQ